MIIHQTVQVYPHSVLLLAFRQPPQEPLAVRIFHEYPAASIASYGNVVDGAIVLQSQLSSHSPNVPSSPPLLNPKLNFKV